MNPDAFFAVLLAASCLMGSALAKSTITQSLNGTWIAKSSLNETEYPATVPGGIYSDLMDLKVIDDILTLYHDNDTRWVGTANWTYTLNFTLNSTLLTYQQVNLVFEGVDTFSEVELNDVMVGATDNMFVRYHFDVTDALEEGVNTLKVTLLNAPEVAQKLNATLAYPIPPDCPPEDYHGLCDVNLIRKMKTSFGQPWGPAFPSMGMWKPVYLQAIDDGALDYVVARVDISNDGENYILVVDAYFIPNKLGYIHGTLTPKWYVKFSQGIYKSFDVNETVNADGELVKSVSLLVDFTLVNRWWPNGYGEQPLYNLFVTFTSGIDGSVTTKRAKIGVRFVEIVQEPLAAGGTFYVKVNDVPIFVKGANQIPLHILPERGMDRQQIRRMLQSAKEANMNMIRLWGGGVYESSYFYEVADQLGIMIWQDFMFASSLYPATSDYLSSVRTEVRQNFKRLFYHPSIVMYSANNENEALLANNVYNTSGSLLTYKKDYISLYVDTIREEVYRLTQGNVAFVSSTPTNGNLTEREGWMGSNPQNQLWGDVHFFDYEKDPWNATNFPIPRFCSEYGYQSFPVEDSWMTVTNDTADLDVTGPLMSWRQHQTDGTERMTRLIGQNLKLPSLDSSNYTSAFIYLSQVYSAQATRIQTEHYRRYRSYLTADGRGYTMGALYWQLNEIWVAPTWSTIDFTGRWKMLHYFAKNFFADLIVTGIFNAAGTLQLYTVNDRLTGVDDVTAVVRLCNYSDLKVVNETRLQLNVSGAASQLIQDISTDTVLQDMGCDKDSCFFYFVLEQTDATANESVAISPDNYAFPGKLKDAKLTDATVTIIDVQTSSKNAFYVTVSVSNVALFVWLDAHQVPGHFSNNGFLQVTANRTVIFYSDLDVSLKEVRANLTVTHLKDSRWA